MACATWAAPQEALAAIEEALGLWRELVAANPAHQPGLVMTLQNLGAGLRDLGRPQEALAATRKHSPSTGNWPLPTPPTSPNSP